MASVDGLRLVDVAMRSQLASARCGSNATFCECPVSVDLDPWKIESTVALHAGPRRLARSAQRVANHAQVSSDKDCLYPGLRRRDDYLCRVGRALEAVGGEGIAHAQGKQRRAQRQRLALRV